MYWSFLYVCKVVEYIYWWLLGCLIYGCKEINYYFDICVKKGLYVLVDVIIDSQEYNEVFGEDIIFYECYLIFVGLFL